MLIAVFSFIISIYEKLFKFIFIQFEKILHVYVIAIIWDY